MKNQSAFLISILAIGLSIVVIILFFVRVSPNSVVDLGTFIGVCAAFIGIAVTLLIGYQIYNAVEIKNKLAEISDIKKQLLSLKNGTEVLRNETYEAINILQSRDPNLKAYIRQMCCCISCPLCLTLFLYFIKRMVSDYSWMS